MGKRTEIIPLQLGIFLCDFTNMKFELVYIEVKILKGSNHKESYKSRSIEMLEFLISFRNELQLL